MQLDADESRAIQETYTLLLTPAIISKGLGKKCRYQIECARFHE